MAGPLSSLPNKAASMQADKTVSYRTARYTGDDGLWTVIKVTEEPILLAPSEWQADQIIKALLLADRGGDA